MNQLNVQKLSNSLYSKIKTNLILDPENDEIEKSNLKLVKLI